MRAVVHAVVGVRREHLRRQERSPGRPADDLPQAQRAGHVLPLQHVLFPERGEKDLPRAGPVEIVRDVDLPVGTLVAVGVGGTAALVEQQPALPRRAVVAGDVGRQLRAPDVLVDRPVLHQDQVSGLEAADEEAARRMFDLRRFERRPGHALVV